MNNAKIPSNADLPTPPLNPVPRRAPGRPCEYTTEIGETICSAMRLGGMSVRKICLCEEMPSRATVYRWLQKIPEFRELYTMAREDQADKIIEEMLIIADDISRDLIDSPKGPVPNPVALRRAQLRIQTRQWILRHHYSVYCPLPQKAREEKPRPKVLTLEEFRQRMKDAEA